MSAIERLSELGQEHLIQELPGCDEEKLLAQLQPYTPAFVQMQRESWLNKEERHPFMPMRQIPTRRGKETIPPNQLAVVLLAGGAGSRLGTAAPKGCFPLLGKSLFERHCTKIPKDLPVAVLTSRLNHAETVAFFEKHRFFGLRKLSFFSQGTLPLLNEEGHWFWNKAGEIAEGADGNGSVFAALEASGLAAHFQKEGIRALQILPVDNSLADPLDAPLKEGVDLLIKCIRVEDPQEPMGRLVEIDGKLGIVEFAELGEEEKQRNLFANTGLLTIELAFARKLAGEKFPLHWAWRNRAWKGERLIVDALFFARRPLAVGYQRLNCFAPLKEKNSIVEIERLLMEKEKPAML